MPAGQAAGLYLSWTIYIKDVGVVKRIDPGQVITLTLEPYTVISIVVTLVFTAGKFINDSAFVPSGVIQNLVEALQSIVTGPSFAGVRNTKSSKDLLKAGLSLRDFS